jgi:hypothetical protein
LVGLTPSPDAIIVVIPGILAIGGLISIGKGVYESEYTSDEGEIVQETPYTGTADSYEPSHPKLPAEVTLPVGFYLVEQGVERGYGWEYIAETTSLTQNQIHDAINNPDRVIREDDVRYVIDELANGKEVILKIIGGTLMAASADSFVNDPCDQSETLGRKSNVLSKRYSRAPTKCTKRPSSTEQLKVHG